jgi:hypothetical protein
VLSGSRPLGFAMANQMDSGQGGARAAFRIHESLYGINGQKPRPKVGTAFRS